VENFWNLSIAPGILLFYHLDGMLIGSSCKVLEFHFDYR